MVEDEPDIAALIAYQLTREGYRVETTSNGTEAVLRDRLSALGWPVRVKGAERLGRRVFIGPLETEPEEETAETQKADAETGDESPRILH